MKLLTWNINGIRACKIPLSQLFDSLDSDIICLQETKITRDMLDEIIADVEGYNAYFSFSRKRSGYSGVATYCKNSCTPVKAEEGLSNVYSCKDAQDLVGSYGDLVDFSNEELVSLDCEGRAVITQHEIRLKDSSSRHLAIINVYCPRYDAENEDRHQYKLRFFALLQVRAEALKKQGSHVIILGDINTTHRPLDHCEPESEGGSNSLPSRLWLNQMIWPPQRDSDLDNKHSEFTDHCLLPTYVTGGLFIDTFRYLHPKQEGAYTNWCTLTGARQTNFGRRLDYILCDYDLAETTLTECTIMAMVMGSDHCPVQAVFDFVVVTAIRRPSLCAKLMPEFAGQQQKLSSFFVKSTASKGKVTEETKESYTNLQSDFGLDCKSGENQKCEENKKCEENQKYAENPKYEENQTKNNSTSKSLLKISSEPSLKRASSSSSDFKNQSKEKKAKLLDDKTTPKQTSLVGFFSRNNPLLNTEFSNKTPTNNSSPLASSNEANSKYNPPKPKELPEREVSLDGEAHNSQGSLSDSGGAKFPENSQIDSQSNKRSLNSSSAWKLLMKGPPPAPLCPQHKEPCVLRTVKKAGPNKGKQFFTCARPEGAVGNVEARCNYFVWVKDLKR